MLLSFLAFLCGGAAVGLLAGLTGAGGGSIVVPMLDLVFPRLGYDPAVVHQLALGTSLASIAFTSFASARAHAKRGAVRMDVVRSMAPGIVCGTFAGGVFASGLPSGFLRAFFACVLLLVSVNMYLGLQPKAARGLPGPPGGAAAGGVIGLVSGFAGIGGASLSVPFLSFCGVPIHQAVGTSSALGFPLAVAGTLGYLLGGWNAPGLPSGCLGYVNLAALAGVALASTLAAPLGARLSHSMPKARLRKFFACFLFLVALGMLRELL